jgi:voltage-gated potassium channel
VPTADATNEVLPGNSPERLKVWYERLTIYRAVGTILVVAALLVLGGGALARIVEPATFKSLGLAYWWALTTVTTVGYGDVVPHELAGRLVGAMLMLTGLSLIPTITSVVVSALVSKRAEAQREEERRMYEEQAERLARMEQQLSRIDPGATTSRAAAPSAPAEARPPRATRP